jgi:hypothetical protein
MTTLACQNQASAGVSEAAASPRTVRGGTSMGIKARCGFSATSQPPPHIVRMFENIDKHGNLGMPRPLLRTKI